MEKIKLYIIISVAVLSTLVVGAIILNLTKDDGSQDLINSVENNGASSNSSQNQSSTNAVSIQDYSFTPANITIKKGTTVTWTNQDGVEHDVAPDDPSDDFQGSELLGKGESYSFTFEEAGTYTYHCSPHPYMKGTVEVIE